MLDDARFRDKISRLEIELMALAMTNLSVFSTACTAGATRPGAEVSMLKIEGTEIQQSLTELMTDTGGRGHWRRAGCAGGNVATMPTTSLRRRCPVAYCNYRKTTIYAGSNEIQRNIIAKAVLGL